MSDRLLQMPFIGTSSEQQAYQASNNSYSGSVDSPVGSLTKSIILSPSNSLQFLFFSLWASSMTTQRHGLFRSSGQSVKIISNVVMMAWNL
jgi:hypothetical protein